MNENPNTSPVGVFDLTELRRDIAVNSRQLADLQNQIAQVCKQMAEVAKAGGISEKKSQKTCRMLARHRKKVDAMGWAMIDRTLAYYESALADYRKREKERLV